MNSIVNNAYGGDNAAARSSQEILSRIDFSPGLKYPVLAQEALQFVRAKEHPAVFNHSIRTYLYARYMAAGDDQDANQDALFMACLFHDAGTVDDFNGDQRFEIEGADAAARFLEREGWKPAEIEPVWEAIALHTSAGIAERFGALPRYTRLGVRVDFGDHDLLGAPDVLASAEADFARVDIERVLSELVVTQSTGNTQKAPPATWPGELLRAHLDNPDSNLLNRAF